MHSYAAPSHERRLGDILAREFPEILVSLSCEISPEIQDWDGYYDFQKTESGFQIARTLDQ